LILTVRSRKLVIEENLKSGSGNGGEINDRRGDDDKYQSVVNRIADGHGGIADGDEKKKKGKMTRRRGWRRKENDQSVWKVSGIIMSKCISIENEMKRLKPDIKPAM